MFAELSFLGCTLRLCHVVLTGPGRMEAVASNLKSKVKIMITLSDGLILSGSLSKTSFPRFDYHALAYKSSCLMITSGSKFHSVRRVWVLITRTVVVACSEGVALYPIRFCVPIICYLEKFFERCTAESSGNL